MKFMIEKPPTTAGCPCDKEYGTVERGMFEYYISNGSTDNSIDGVKHE